MVPERAHWSALSASCGLQHVCRSRFDHQCLIRIGSFLCIDDEPHVVPDGSLLTFNYNLDEVTQAAPRISLLQVNTKLHTHPSRSQEGSDERGGWLQGNLPSSSSVGHQHRPADQHVSEDEPMDEDGLEQPNLGIGSQDDPPLFNLHMFHRIGDYMTIQFRKGKLAHQRAQIADGWGVRPEEIVGIHPIRAPPSDLANDDQTLFSITRWARDADYRTFPTDVQCLFDVELHSGHNFEAGPKIFRHVEWSRRLVTREGLLHRLWIGDFCRLIANDACLVWHNNLLWSAQDFVPRAVTAGDYFRVAIPARLNQDISALRDMLRTAEEQQRDHAMFPSTPEPTSSEESRDSEATQYGPPTVLPEPEPHDQFDIVRGVLEDWMRSRQ